MGILDFLKSGKTKQTEPRPADSGTAVPNPPAPKPSAPEPSKPESAAPKSAAEERSPAAPQAGLEPVWISFEAVIPYRDPEYSLLELVVSGDAAVVSEAFPDEEKAAEPVRSLLRFALSQGLMQLGAERCPYEKLADRIDVLTERCIEALAEREIAVSAFAIGSVSPSESSLRMIELQKKRKEAAAMTPEDLEARMEAARRSAQEAWDKMTPEERRAAEEKAKKTAAELGEQTRKQLEEARKAFEEKKEADAAGTAEKTAARAEPSIPKFCPECGTPTNGGRFCTNCGTKLA